MRKKGRILLPGYPHHILRATSGGKTAFHSGADFRYASAELKALSQTYEIDVHAYCILSDRVQLLATPRRGPELISTFMKSFSTRIALRNRKLYGTRSLWSPRFHASPVEPGQWVIACMAYIESEPARLGLVRTPALYHFSSFRLRARQGKECWLVDLPEFSHLGDSAAARLEGYKLYLRNGLNQRDVKVVLDALRGNRVTGSSRFRNEVNKRLGVFEKGFESGPKE